MRLTVFHNEDPHPLWEHSLNKLITPLTYKDLKKQGDVHTAVFNDGVVGISVSKENQIIYLKVRDITRRRGVGKYLIEETLKAILEDYDKVEINTDRFPVNEIDGLIYFLTMQGFQKDEKQPNIYYFEE
ncbi:MAG: acetyl-CoA sensor PanZ family protein [Succinivibrionaceae bacterium]|nr:acetyl-CoA sensor PanZ family protein [Ruminobacter sp.]MEE1339899.1 acetyl-CoA sensor PanZ family protein [Succinivibrionaceae bacterium]